MFHAHKTEFAEKGWMGLFLVRESGEYNNSSNTNYNLTNNNKDTRNSDAIQSINFPRGMN